MAGAQLLAYARPHRELITGRLAFGTQVLLYVAALPPTQGTRGIIPASVTLQPAVVSRISQFFSADRNSLWRNGVHIHKRDVHSDARGN